MIPEDLKYSTEHEWVRTQSQTPDTVRIGVTHHAQDALGDIVFVQLPAAGTVVTVGTAIGEIESTKSVSDIFAPVSGTVVAVNPSLEDAPELVNTEPYGDGWMLDIRASDLGQLADLLDAEGYAAHIAH